MPQYAKYRGIAFRGLAQTAPRGPYAALVMLRVTATSGATHVARGTLGADREPRLIGWDDFDVEARLQSPALVVTSIDRPGVVGFLGTTLGAAGVYVAHVHLGRSESGGRAVSVWNLDQPPGQAVLDALRSA